MYHELDSVITAKYPLCEYCQAPPRGALVTKDPRGDSDLPRGHSQTTFTVF